MKSYCFTWKQNYLNKEKNVGGFRLVHEHILYTPTMPLKDSETKGYLLLERKAVTNLDSILKSRDIILMTKVHKVKTMVLPVVMYLCESWAIKKAEC